MTSPRQILHVDMDAFFASVEQRDHPEWRGRPVLVGSPERRGVVAAASYEARRFGCRSAMPMAVALRRCPDAVVARPRGSAYREASRDVFAILRDAAPKVEPLSIDEAFLDLTGTERLLGEATVVAEEIRARIRAETGLTASVGVAPNKFLAKLASDLDKPDGLTVIRTDTIDTILPPLPVTRIWGVGPVTARRMTELGIHTIADLRRQGLEELTHHFGSAGPHYHRLARGIDDREVVEPGEAKSISHELTFTDDLESPAAVRAELLHLTEAVARRLRAHDLQARTVTVKIRSGDFETITRSTTLPSPTDVTDEIWKAAADLFERWARSSFRPVRLIGVGTSHLGHEATQLGLFPDRRREKRRSLDAAMDRIRDRFGRNAIRRRPEP